jgi:hypothetical protein
MPLAFNWAMSTSLSKVFLEQPKVTTFTFVAFSVLAFMSWRAYPVEFLPRKGTEHPSSKGLSHVTTGLYLRSKGSNAEQPLSARDH